MRNMKTTVLAATLASAMMLAGTAQAANVNAKLISVAPGLSDGVNGGVFNFETIAAGTDFTGVLANGPAGKFIAFCLDLDQTIAVGSTTLFKVGDVADAPTPGSSMGTDKATDIAKLVGGVLAGSFGNVSTTLDSSQKAAAFQLAIWEIVNEDAANGYNVKIGDFSGGNNLTVQNLANDYLATIVGATAATGLFALLSDTKQDFLVQVVPIPAAAWLLGSGLLGLFGLARRRKAAASA